MAVATMRIHARELRALAMVVARALHGPDVAVVAVASSVDVVVPPRRATLDTAVVLVVDGAQTRRGAGVEGELAAEADDLDAVDGLLRGEGRGAGAEPRHADPGLDPPARDLVHVLLGPAGLRVAHVAPVQDQDVGAREAGGQGLGGPDRDAGIRSR